ncbi:amidase family protein [Kribbella sp. NPDC051718]|uniref:amidase family protein n=1 Tax=Kribbella sp. NPDC051718 TaxID=3155168 RepID=UPI00341AB9EE
MNRLRTATEAAAAIRAGQASSRELTEDLLARIAADTTVNAIIETRPEYALAAATAADKAAARGPLHGVPMTVKDAIEVAGLHTTWGNPAFADYVPTSSAPLVERLTRAGAIIVGKSNVHTMLGDFGQTQNELYGRTNNPHDPTRTPGGSSGGGAAALAAGLTYLEYGSDLVGSIRLPAAYCGVYGLKPTAGVVPLNGFQPPGPPAPATEFPNPSSLGPLANSAADLRTALEVTGGPTGKAMSWHLEPPRHRKLADYRVGVVLDHPDAPVIDEVGKALSDQLDTLASQGVKIVEGWPEAVDPTAQAEAFGFQIGLFFAMYGEDADFAPLAQVIQEEQRRMATRAAWQRYFEDIDVFLCPTSFTTAFPHDDRPFEERTIDGRPYDAQVFWISHASLTGLPAVSMPIPTSGLPVGAQVISAFHEDDTAITFAELAAD